MIVLSKEDQELCRRTAKERMDNDTTAGVVDAFIGKQNKTQAELDGFGAEVAFCRMFKCKPDLSTEPRSGGFDTVLPDGRTVDVKNDTHNYPQAWLKVKKSKKDNPADLYALVIGKFPIFQVKGWMKAKELFKDENLKDFGYGPGKEAYTVSEKELKLV